MLTLERFRRLETRLRAMGYDDMIAWSETVQPPPNADKLAQEIAWVDRAGHQVPPRQEPRPRRAQARRSP